MSENEQKSNNFILNPPVWMRILVAVLTVLSVAGSIVMVCLGFDGQITSIIAYVLFAVAGLSLAYSVYLIIAFAPKAKEKIIEKMEGRAFTRNILRSFGFRTVIFATFSLTMSIIFGLFNGFMGIMNRSIWYGALSAYYIFLALLRGGILTYHKNRIGKQLNEESEEIKKAKIYRNSGIILLVLNVALSSSIAQMIFSDAHFSYVGWTIFGFAVYAFYKITVSVIGFVKAHKQTDLTVRALRNVNLTDGFVSILALQTALLATFGDGSIDVSTFNTITGIVVSAVSVGLGVYMIVSASRKLKFLRQK